MGATPGLHIDALVDNLAEPGRLEAARAMALASSAAIDARLDDIDLPTLVIMGTADPDFPDPAAEAQTIADRVDGRVVLVEEAGYYPHVQEPDVTAGAILTFLGQQPTDGP